MLRFCLLCAIALFVPTRAATFTVTTRLDGGAGSLRQAITDANASPGLDTIVFNIPGDGVQTVEVSGLLPDITDPLLIDGTTQRGFNGSPLIEIAGTSRSSVYVLKITAGSSTVRGIIIGNVSSTSPSDGIILTGAGGNKVAGCWLGLSANGQSKGRIRGGAIHITNSADNVIGGTNLAERNVISGTSSAGIVIEGNAATGNKIFGNLIGLDPGGALSLGSFFNGVLITNAPGNHVGGLETGAGNVISGNGSDQVKITGSASSSNLVQGNLIGLKADGSALSTDTGSGGNGVRIDNAPSNLLGGTESAARNVIGNCNFAINVNGSNSVGNLIQGNYIGTDPTGLAAVSNQFGIRISAGASGTLIGGTAAGARNVIAATKVDALSISDSSSNTVQGNFIGTDATGQNALGNTTPGTQGSGITVASISAPATGNLIGGTAPGARNVVSGNNDLGIVLLGPDAQQNFVQGNYIGLSADGKKLLGNGSSGVAVLGANNNVIGGVEEGAGNMIAGNGVTQTRPGVWLAGLFGSFGVIGTGNVVSGNTTAASGGAGVALLGANEIGPNRFINNRSIPIDRGGDGPTANNDSSLSNYPEFSDAQFGSIRLWGRLKGGKNCEYTLQVYVRRKLPEPLTLIFGEGEDVLPAGQFTVKTDAAGQASFDGVELPFDGLPGDEVSGTVFSSKCGAETSEMAPFFRIRNTMSDTLITFERLHSEVLENDGTLSIKVKRTGNLTVASSVRVTTSTLGFSFLRKAVPGVDFMPVDERLIFAPGETSKTITVTINDDTIYTGDRTFSLILSEPSNAVLAGFGGNFGFSGVDIRDNEIPVARKINIAKIMEGIEIGYSEPVDDQVFFQSTIVEQPVLKWETVGFISPGQKSLKLLPPLDPNNPGEFFRAMEEAGYANLRIDLKLNDGSAPSNLDLQIGKYGPVDPANLLSNGFSMPTGAVTVAVVQKTAFTNLTLTNLFFTNMLDVVMDITGDLVAAMKADMQAETNAPPPCGCTPWAGAVGGSIGGVQKVVIGGGANGKCDEGAVVHITGPGGVDVVLGPKEKRRRFSPAADGTWTVTSTVCGQMKTATITLP